MKEYITKSQLRSFASEILAEDRKQLRKTAKTRSVSNATFLSHSSSDNDLVVGAIQILENHGAQVYIDEIDTTLPSNTSKKTASVLKSRIRDSKKFVLLATENSLESNWVPWELGFADGVKDLPKIALFPAVETSYQISWTKREYMGLYQRIIWGDIKEYENAMWIVLDEENNTALPLRKWLDS